MLVVVIHRPDEDPAARLQKYLERRKPVLLESKDLRDFLLKMQQMLWREWEFLNSKRTRRKQEVDKMIVDIKDMINKPPRKLLLPLPSGQVLESEYPLFKLSPADASRCWSKFRLAKTLKPYLKKQWLTHKDIEELKKIDCSLMRDRLVLSQTVGNPLLWWNSASVPSIKSVVANVVDAYLTLGGRLVSKYYQLPIGVVSDIDLDGKLLKHFHVIIRRAFDPPPKATVVEIKEELNG